jgi:hypothetical protein
MAIITTLRLPPDIASPAGKHRLCWLRLEYPPVATAHGALQRLFFIQVGMDL